MRDLSPRVSLVVLFVTLLLCGVWPYHEMLAWLPWGLDASKWVGNGDPHWPGWTHWAFGSKHFVGYRPVTALSFTINQLLTGDLALGYRGTDLLLHVVTGGLLFATYRSLTGDKSVFGLIPVIWLFGHPATEEVVPYAARRSYLLAMSGGLSSLLLWMSAPRPADVRAMETLIWSSAAAVLLGFGLLSNEIAYVFVPLLPLAALIRSEPPVRVPSRSMMLAHLPVVLVVLGALAARYVVLGKIGGYNKRYFAVVVNGVPQWRELTQFEPVRIFTAAFDYLFLPGGVSGQAPLLWGMFAQVFSGAVMLWLVWITVGRWAVGLCSAREGRVRLLLLAWLVGAVGIVVLSQTWFWRQAHAMLFPFAMLATWELKDSARALFTRRTHPLLSIGSIGIGGLLLLAAIWNGPLWTGMDLRPHLNTIAGSPMIGQIERLMVPIPTATRTGVWLVAPLRANGGHILRMWGNKLGRPKGIFFRLLAHSRPGASPSDAVLDLDRSGRPRLTLRKGLVVTAGLGQSLGKGNTIEVDRLWRKESATWLFALDADDAWAVQIPPPPQGIEPLPEIEDPDRAEDMLDAIE